ncbi:glycosyltransferase family 4 protein [Antribacter gilvus]|uniref:glycosyltransferase family 4 protein n=1 Tax=Antribacter gilvus TaxID=2304675 RepID=UPI00198052BD|nr:glycosyltransferase family 1 protein [Antribacter gilvus]
MTETLDAPPGPARPRPTGPRRIMIVTDTWAPQVNGVARALGRMVAELREMGCDVEVVTPADGFRTVPLITYSEIRVPVRARDDIERRFLDFAPDAVHLATEGPLGWTARNVCLHYGFPFTTSYHTQFPEYVTARWSWVPLWAGYEYMRRFHATSGRVLVTTPTMREQLTERRFQNIAPWSLGVDTEVFHPRNRGADGGVYRGLPGPVFAYVGRLAVEKNVEAFCALDLPGSKVVVGDGPARADLQHRFPEVHFRGSRSGTDLARHFADADVLVFPSRTDTFGLVILEAMASGTPVAGFDAPGPRDLIPGTGAGAVSLDLREAALLALTCDRKRTREYAERFSWRACAEAFHRSLDVLPLPDRAGRLVQLQQLTSGVITRLPTPRLSTPDLSWPDLPWPQRPAAHRSVADRLHTFKRAGATRTLTLTRSLPQSFPRIAAAVTRVTRRPD